MVLKRVQSVCVCVCFWTVESCEILLFLFYYLLNQKDFYEQMKRFRSKFWFNIQLNCI